MINIIRAKSMGYCMGVERAVKLAEAGLAEHKSLTSLGLLIHNQQENQRLADLGLTFVDVENLPMQGNGQRLLVRAHGLDPAIQVNLQQRGYQLLNATCPLVEMNQKDVAKAKAAGYYVVIAGKPDHAEIIALKGFADANRLAIVSSVEQALALEVAEQQLFVISQTTLRPDLYQEIKGELAKRYVLHEYRSSICPATQERQQAVKELSQQVQVMIVVGDSHSANTKGLQESALAMGVPTYLISDASELDVAALQGYHTIGLTAGASVPSYIIDAVEAALRKNL